MKKMAKGFTLVELLVVIGILGVLMAVLVPNITGAKFKTDLQTFSKQGSDIVGKGILSQSLDRASKGKPSLWPHNTEADGMSDDADDIAGKQYGTATEYFKVLFDINNQGNSEGWRPYIDQSMLPFLWGQGVPARSSRRTSAGRFSPA